jgi:hypothetical protein
MAAVDHLYAHQNVRDCRLQANALDLLYDQIPVSGRHHCDAASAGRRPELGVSLKVDAEKPDIAR